MKIKLYRSSTIGLDLNGYKLLMDPWLTDGEYYGSWSHYPYYDLDKNINEINSYNAIYISHIHPDHCSDDTLKKIFEFVGPICESTDKFLTVNNFQNLKEGDNIIICDVGAYGMSLSSNYNVRPLPAEILIKNSKIQVIRNRQKLSDLI